MAPVVEPELSPLTVERFGPFAPLSLGAREPALGLCRVAQRRRRVAGERQRRNISAIAELAGEGDRLTPPVAERGEPRQGGADPIVAGVDLEPGAQGHLGAVQTMVPEFEVAESEVEPCDLLAR